MMNQLKGLLTNAFHHVDQGKTGSIQASELERVLCAYYRMTNKNIDEAQATKMADDFLATIQKDRNYLIELEEFLQFFTKAEQMFGHNN